MTSLMRNPVFYGSLGLILVALPCLYYFFMGVSGTMVTETEYANGNRSKFVETVRQGAFNPFLLIFIIGAGVAAYGCSRNTQMAWIGSIFVLVYSILAVFSIGLLLLPGALLLIIGSALKTMKKKCIELGSQI
jgi:hypothetical protein